MFFSKDTLLSSILAASSLGGLGLAAPTDGAAKIEARKWKGDENFEVKTFYRADTRSPEEIEKGGGMWARGYSPGSDVPPDISLYNHVNGMSNGKIASSENDGYVSFTADQSIALYWLEEVLKTDGYIYQVHASPNLVDVQGILKHYNPYPFEKEFAAIIGVGFEQIMGWTEYHNKPDRSGDHFENQGYIMNKRYDSARFDHLKHGGAVYFLAGFGKNHIAWSQEPWVQYAFCDPEENPNPGSPSKLFKKSYGTNALCGPTKTNQEFAQQYVDDLNAGKFNPPP